MPDEGVEDYFFKKGNHAYKAILEDEIVGIYYLRSNQSGEVVILLIQDYGLRKSKRQRRGARYGRTCHKYS